jgi:hypothetical protein
MKFKTHNDNIPFMGGSLQGYIDASYIELEEIFGTPTDGDGYKVDAEWEILFDDGTFCTIYNWKDGENYNGKNGMPIEDIRDWHIGGNNTDAIPHLNNLLKKVTKC